VREQPTGTTVVYVEAQKTSWRH